MATTREQMAADRAAFDDEFDQEHVAPRAASDEEVFGLLDDDAPEDHATGKAAQDAQTQSKAHADTPDPATRQKTQQLQEWEQRLQEQQIALDARAAAIGTSNVNQQQDNTSLDSPGTQGADGIEAGSDGAHASDAGIESDAAPDPAIRLVEDFGADFVALVKLLVAQECKANLHDCMGDVSSKVEQLIAELQEDRQQHHYRAIAAVHADFQEIVDSPEFNAWQKSQPAEQIPEIERVINSGSTHEIIDLLTRFKEANTASHSPESKASQSKSVPHVGKVGSPDKDFDDVADIDDFDDFDKDDFNDAALDAAEGVRSGGGLKLPKAPPASDDYSAAWDEA